MPSASPWRWLVVAGLVLPISILHYLTPQFENVRHLIYRELYLLPIFLASFWYGLRGGIICSLAITAIYLPSTLIWSARPDASQLGNLFQMIVFNLFAVTVGLMRDRDIRRQQEQAKLSNLAAMGRAVSSIAHDLKSPLAAVGGFVVQVRRKLEQGDPAARKLDIAIEQVAHMETMVKDMLAFARPLELRTGKIELNQLLEQVVEVAQAAKGREDGITTDLDPSIPALNLDADRMQQAVLNLVNNAIEVSPPDGEVTVTSRSRADRVQIEVRDQGAGITPEIRENLFTPFMTTKKGGTGLGLAITKKIVEAHGGRLFLNEAVSPGTAFVVELPTTA